MSSPAGDTQAGQLDAIAAGFKAAVTRPRRQQFVKQVTRRGRVRLVPALSRRTRARLWLASRVDAVACWLVEHDHLGAAAALWRACGMWR